MARSSRDSGAVRLRILELIAEGYYTYTNSIAKALRLPHATANYHIRQMVREDLLTSANMGAMKHLELTSKAIQYIQKHRKGGDLLTSSEGLSPHFSNLHNLQFTVAIRKDAEIFFPNSKQMRNWLAQYDWFGDVYVEKTPRSLVFRLEVAAGNHWEAKARGQDVVLRLIDQLEKGYGIELGHPLLTRKPHYTVVGDPVAEEASKAAIVHVPGVGHIDRSKDTGHLEYYDPERVGRYIRLPDSMAEATEILRGVRRMSEENLAASTMMASSMKDLADSTGQLAVAQKSISDSLQTLIQLLQPPQEQQAPPRPMDDKDQGAYI